MSLVKHWIVLAGALALAACGDDESETKPKEVTDTQTVDQGKSTGEKSLAVAQLMPGADSAAAQGPVTQLGSSLQAFIGRYQQVKAQAAAGQQPEGGQPAGGQPAAGQPGLPAGAGMAGLTAAHFAQAVENTFTYEDGHMSGDLTYDSVGTSIHYTVDLDIAQEETSVTMSGSFSLDFTSTQATYEVTYDMDATYDALKFESNCPVGGGFTVTYSISVGGAAFENLPPEARAQAEKGIGGGGTVSATFGPGCGEVAVSGT